MAGEREPTRFAIHAEGGDIVCTLVAAIKEPASRIEIEAARVVAAGPFLGDEREFAVFGN